MYQRILANFNIALEAVLANKLRSLLTGLGIIFGVAAVIAMMAIGSGAQEEILEQIKLVGVNNIVITPIVEQEESVLGEGESDEGKDKNLSTGLTMLDARSIERVIPGIEKVSPEIFIDTYIIKNAFRRSAKLVGVENSYFDLSGFELYEGKLFNQIHLDYGKPVCIIGKSIKAKFFSKENPIGKKIKVGNHWLKVIGVLEERHISKKSISNLGIRDYNMDVYTPLKTVLIRYENRALITEAAIKLFNRSNPEEREKSPNYHQLDRLVIQVSETDKLNGVVQVISKILKRRHKDIVDYEISIPELLLKQQQRTKSIFNFVLGAIAGISLLVGGIGIMNIMLASVLERIKEIGLRMSIGAKKADIAYQFLLEAVMISVSGGLVGVVLGSSIAVGVSELAEIPTILSFYSILLSFGVAVSIGVIFGYTPAKRASEQDPITSLRYE
ncbi:MAG: ABC transporter permease, partial [Cyclobacteriaceae bacterium]|nr:ABC transporter permease [Cyclobacteriaceae bacterium]